MDISNSTHIEPQQPGKPDYPMQKAWLPHSAVQIYCWICLTMAVQMLNGYMLALLTGILLIYALKIGEVRFLLLLRRTRWILFSMFIIYACTTPGDALWPQFGTFSPVADGVVDGLLQLTRLLAVLAGLSILLSLQSQSQFIAGLYSLSRPMGLFGLSRERFAVRLALTLRYAECAMQDCSSNWRSSLEHILDPRPDMPGFIELKLTIFSWRDWLMVMAVSATLLGIGLSLGVLL